MPEPSSAPEEPRSSYLPIESQFESLRSPVEEKHFIFHLPSPLRFLFPRYDGKQASKDDPVMWTVAGSVANATFLFNQSQTVGFRIIRYTGDGYECEPNHFSVAEVDGILVNDSFLFSEPRTMDRMVVVINETRGDEKRVCLFDWQILGPAAEL
jgi:hypothetical protein